jgi:predicted small lipoprotein YifL
MHKLMKLVAIAFVAASIGACGKTGELTPVKAEKVAEQQVEKQQAVAPLTDGGEDSVYCFGGDCFSKPKENTQPPQEMLDFIPQSAK